MAAVRYPMSKLYYEEIIAYDEDERRLRYFSSDDGLLFASNKHISKYKKEDLPDWYIHGRYFKCFGYLNVKDVKEIKLKTSDPKHHNHILKDCSLYISFKEPLREEPDRFGPFIQGYDAIADGFNIVSVLKGIDKYNKNGVDTSEIERAVIQHIKDCKKYQPELFTYSPMSDEYIENLFAE